MRATMRMTAMAAVGALCAAGGCASDDGAGRQRSSTSHHIADGGPPVGPERIQSVASEAKIYPEGTPTPLPALVSQGSSSVRRVEVVGPTTKLADGTAATASFEVFFGPLPGATAGVGMLTTDSDATWEVKSGWAVMRGWRPRARLPRTTIGSEGTTFVVEITNNAEYVYLLKGGPLRALHNGTPLGDPLALTTQYLKISGDPAAPVVELKDLETNNPIGAGEAAARRDFLAHIRNTMIPGGH